MLTGAGRSRAGRSAGIGGRRFGSTRHRTGNPAVHGAGRTQREDPGVHEINRDDRRGSSAAADERPAHVDGGRPRFRRHRVLCRQNLNLKSDWSGRPVSLDDAFDAAYLAAFEAERLNAVRCGSGGRSGLRCGGRRRETRRRSSPKSPSFTGPTPAESQSAVRGRNAAVREGVEPAETVESNSVKSDEALPAAVVAARRRSSRRRLTDDVESGTAGGTHYVVEDVGRSEGRPGRQRSGDRQNGPRRQPVRRGSDPDATHGIETDCRHRAPILSAARIRPIVGSADPSENVRQRPDARRWPWLISGRRGCCHRRWSSSIALLINVPVTASSPAAEHARTSRAENVGCSQAQPAVPARPAARRSATGTSSAPASTSNTADRRSHSTQQRTAVVSWVAVPTSHRTRSSSVTRRSTPNCGRPGSAAVTDFGHQSGRPRSADRRLPVGGAGRRRRPR